MNSSCNESSNSSLDQNKFTPWTVRGGKILSFKSPFIMGIVNVTPDSFSDGGCFFDSQNALNQAKSLYSDGASILDIGGESTRPGAELIGADEEIKRVMPVLRALTQWRVDFLNTIPQQSDAINPSRALRPYISIDTWRSKTAELCLKEGADIINDVYGAVADPALIDILAEYKPGYILGHSTGTPKTMQKRANYNNIMDELCAYFDERINHMIKKGVVKETIMLDPGVGFGKNLEHNLEILNNISHLKKLGFPICIGISRKKMFDHLFHIEGGPKRDLVTAITTALLCSKNIEVHRVHNAQAAFQALTLAQLIN